MKPHTFLLALAAIAGAEAIPQISEPRSIAAAGLSLTAFGDSVYLSKYRLVSLFARTGDRVVLVGERVSDSLDSEHPRFFHFNAGSPDVALGSTRLTVVDRTTAPWSLASGLGNLQIAHRWPTGGTYPGIGATDFAHIIACGQTRAYDLQATIVSGTSPLAWSVVDSLVLPTGGYTVCDVDSRTGQGIVATGDSALNYSFRVGRASNLLHGNPTTVHAQRLDWVSAAWDGQWIAWDGLRHMLYGARGPTSIDSLDIDLDPAAYPSGVVARRDSIVAFGQNGTLVLAKWSAGTPTNFKIVSRTTLSGTRNVASVAIGDSTLWATTGDTLYSFRLGWTRSTAVERTPSPVSKSSLEIRSSGRTILLGWNSPSSAWVDIVDIQGTRAGRIHLEPGQIARWNAPRAGIWFARTGTGSEMFLVR